MVRHFAREHSCALAPGDIKRIRHAGQSPVAHAKSCGIDGELDIFAFYQERARHRAGWHCHLYTSVRLDEDWLRAALYLIIFVGLTFTGAGKFSIDRMLKKSS